MDSYDLNEMLLDTESNRKFFEDLKAEFAKSIKIDTPVLIKNMEEIKPNCKWFWKNISIDGAGNVGSCGRFFIPKKEYGKFYDENVWNGKYFEEMREKFLKNDLTDYCKYCVENSHEE
jgi:hypothetical protein